MAGAFPSLFGDADALAPARVSKESRADGSFVLRHTDALQPYARCIGDWLEHWARHAPHELFLAERNASDVWRQLSFRETRMLVGRLAQGLLNLQSTGELTPGKPLVVLSDNAVDHALIALAAMHVGRPVCTVSSAYSKLSKDFSKIHQILDVLSPGVVYASDATVYGQAVASWKGKAVRVFSQGADKVPGALDFATLAEAPETAAVALAFAAIRPDDHAKYLLTSGSTGTPKVVVNTHRMLCANQQQIAQVWPFLTRHRLVLLEWLPWSHTFGGNHNFNMALSHGGAIYIDEGRPAPGLIEKTLRNLREVRPNLYFNVPRGFEMLLPHLEQDEAARRDVFERLEAVFYAGAALPQSLWQRLEDVARKVRERPVWFTSAWGSTETAPAVTSVHWHIERAGCIGLPLPGVELKFVPNGSKLELRVKGPNVFREYRDAPEVTSKAFDDDGFYLIGDAGRLVDEADPNHGVAFDGRVAEDFKLTTGTWVSVGTLRLRAVTAMAPHVSDVVVTGHDRAELGVLVFPAPSARALPLADLMDHVRMGLRSLQASGGGSSQSPTRAMVMDEPPSTDAGEITDKGYINQRAVLARRADAVAALYEGNDPRVVRP